MVPRPLIFLVVAMVAVVHLQHSAAHECKVLASGTTVCMGRSDDDHLGHVGGRRFVNAAWDLAIIAITDDNENTTTSAASVVGVSTPSATKVYDGCKVQCEGNTVGLMNYDVFQPGFEWRFGVPQNLKQQKEAVRLADEVGGLKTGSVKDILIGAKYTGAYVDNSHPLPAFNPPFNDTDFVWWGMNAAGTIRQPLTAPGVTEAVVMHNEVGWRASNRNSGTTADQDGAGAGSWKTVGLTAKQHGCLCIAVPICTNYNCEDEIAEIGNPSLYPVCSENQEETIDLVKEIVDGKCTCRRDIKRCCTECATGENPYVEESSPPGRMVPTECRTALPDEVGYEPISNAKSLACRPILWGYPKKRIEVNTEIEGGGPV